MEYQNNFQKSQSEKIRAMYGSQPENTLEKSEEVSTEREPTFEDLENMDNLEKSENEGKVTQTEEEKTEE